MNLNFKKCDVCPVAYEFQDEAFKNGKDPTLFKIREWLWSNIRIMIFRRLHVKFSNFIYSMKRKK